MYGGCFQVKGHQKFSYANGTREQDGWTAGKAQFSSESDRSIGIPVGWTFRIITGATGAPCISAKDGLVPIGVKSWTYGYSEFGVQRGVNATLNITAIFQ